MKIVVEEHTVDTSADGGELETNHDGDIISVSKGAGRRNVLVAMRVKDKDVPDDSEQEPAAPQKDEDKNYNVQELSNVEELNAAQVSALEDAGYLTVGDLPDDLDSLTEINGVGPGTIDTLREVVNE